MQRFVWLLQCTAHLHSACRIVRIFRKRTVFYLFNRLRKGGCGFVSFDFNGHFFIVKGWTHIVSLLSNFEFQRYTHICINWQIFLIHKFSRLVQLNFTTMLSMTEFNMFLSVFFWQRQILNYFFNYLVSCVCVSQGKILLRWISTFNINFKYDNIYSYAKII